MSNLYGLSQSEEQTRVSFSQQALSDPYRIQLAEDELLRLVQTAHPRLLVLDFGGVEFASSRALGLIVALQQAISREHARLAMTNAGPQLLALLRLTRLDKVIEIA